MCVECVECADVCGVRVVCAVRVVCGTILMWCEAVTSDDAVNICFMFFDGPLQPAINHVITILNQQIMYY